MDKDFDRWNQEKKRIHANGREIHIRAGDVRWAALGLNVGSEIDGKGEGRYTRPVLVLDILGRHLALVVPVSTKLHTHPGYLHFEIDGKTMALCIHQVRTLAQRRIFNRQAKLSEQRLQQVKDELKTFWRL